MHIDTKYLWPVLAWPCIGWLTSSNPKNIFWQISSLSGEHLHLGRRPLQIICHWCHRRQNEQLSAESLRITGQVQEADPTEKQINQTWDPDTDTDTDRYTVEDLIHIYSLLEEKTDGLFRGAW